MVVDDGAPMVDDGAPPVDGCAGGRLRRVVQSDAALFLADHPAEPGASVVTSLPDWSEVPERGFSGWRSWFVDRCEQIVRWIPPDGVAIFFQSDVRHQGLWVDKGYLVLSGAERAGGLLLWHRIVCRKTPGTPSLGRASYSHMLCLANSPKPPPRHAVADVLPQAGAMPWSKAMGVAACVQACRYLQRETSTRLVVDPFCGKGTVLAVANAMGLAALGVDLSARRCRDARTLRIAQEEV